MTPIEELLYQWADYQRGKAGPGGYPSQSLMRSIYTFKMEEKGGVEIRPLTASGRQTRSTRGDYSPEWPDMVNQMDSGLTMLADTNRRAYYALMGYYLGKVPGKVRQDEKGLSRGWREVHRGAGEAKDAYIGRLSRAMPWNLSKASFYQHMKQGHESLSAFIRGMEAASV
jgi:hypothetical protein